jgi:hypothetical protein
VNVRPLTQVATSKHGHGRRTTGMLVPPECIDLTSQHCY